MDASSALFSNQLIRGLSLATSSPDKFTRDVRSVDIPSNAIALAISRFPAFWFNSRISLTFHERCVPCALDPLAVAKKKKEREKRKVNDLQRNLLFLQVRFERLAPLENPKIEERISFRVEHAISSFRRREFREISRDFSSYFTLGERITGKSRFLFVGRRTMLLIKSRKQLIFSLTRTTVSSRDERAHAPLSLSLSFFHDLCKTL